MSDNETLLRTAFSQAGQGDPSALVDLYADDVVTATVRCYRRKGDHVMDTTIVMVHRFDDGRVTRGADVCPAAFDTFRADAGYAG